MRSTVLFLVAVSLVALSGAYMHLDCYFTNLCQGSAVYPGATSTAYAAISFSGNALAAASNQTANTTQTTVSTTITANVVSNTIASNITTTVKPITTADITNSTTTINAITTAEPTTIVSDTNGTTIANATQSNQTTTVVVSTAAAAMTLPNITTRGRGLGGFMNQRVESILSSFNSTYGNKWIYYYNWSADTQGQGQLTVVANTSTSLEGSMPMTNKDLNNMTALNISQVRSLMSALHQFVGTNPNASLVILNQSISLQYGKLKRYGKAYSAGDEGLYFAVYSSNSILALYNITVSKASPSPCIYTNLEPVPYCTNSTAPLQIHVPVINGTYALTGQDWYPLNITFNASLQYGNEAPFNFTVKDVSNGTVLIPLTTITSNSVYVSEKFKIPVTQSIEISFSSGGNANYSKVIDDPLTIPTDIVEYVPITLTNSQGTGVENNFQMGLSVNSLAYQGYESSNLDNIEFFYANGTLVPSWLEGNVLNNRQSTNLYTSTNTFYWLNIPANFLPASSSNTLYMGFAANSINLLDGVNTGEAPQLSSQYGQYDNGGRVFLYYNVNPSSTSGWTLHGTAGVTTAPAGSNFGSANALYANSANGDYMYTSVPGLGANEIISFDVYTNGLGDFFFLTSSSGAGQMGRLDGRGGGDLSGLANTASWTSWSAPGGGLDEGYNTWYKYDIVVTGTSASAYIGGNTLSLDTYGTLANSQSIVDNGNYLGLVGDGLGSGHITYWDGMIARYYPPGGVMPSATFGSPLATNAPALLVMTPNPVTYGNTASLQAICYPSTDTCEVLVDSVLEASGTGSATYTFPVSAVGTYSVNAFNVNQGYSALGTLTVNKATPAITLPNFPQELIYGNIATVTANIMTYNNQLSANDYVNGIFQASFNTQDQFTEGAVGTYVITANTPGNGNYFATSVSQTFNICPAAGTVPAGIVEYACATLDNSQTSATGNYFQQLFNITESQFSGYISYNGNIANFEYFYTNGTVMPAWIEGNSLGKLAAWARVNPSVVANGNYVAYIGFAGANTNLLSSTGTYGIGEAPTLSASYGEYDDGNSVFDGYFPGNSVAGWTVAGIAGQSTSAPSGSPFGTDAFYANGANGDYLYTQAQDQSANMIIEYYTDTANLDDLFFLASSAGAGQIARVGNGAGWYGIASSSSWTSWTAPPDAGTWSNEWVTIGIVVAAGSATMYLVPGGVDYGSELGHNQSNVYTVANDGTYLGLVGDAAGGSTTEYWNGAIVRSYPPGGIMPLVSYSKAEAVSATCTISLSTNALSFGLVEPGSKSSTGNLITDTNSGTSTANILIYGTDWAGPGANSFGVGNTVWSGSAGVAYGSANALTSGPVNTGLSVGGGNNANVFVGIGVPPGTQSGIYTQGIVIENSC